MGEVFKLPNGVDAEWRAVWRVFEADMRATWGSMQGFDAAMRHLEHELRPMADLMLQEWSYPLPASLQALPDDTRDGAAAIVAEVVQQVAEVYKRRAWKVLAQIGCQRLYVLLRLKT